MPGILDLATGAGDLLRGADAADPGEGDPLSRAVGPRTGAGREMPERGSPESGEGHAQTGGERAVKR